MSIGKRIEEFRKMNQTRFPNKSDLAKSLKINGSQLTRYLSDERKPPADLLERFAFLGCDIHWLVTGITFEERSELYNSLLEAININEAVAASFPKDAEGYMEEMAELKKRNEELEQKMKELLNILKPE